MEDEKKTIYLLRHARGYHNNNEGEVVLDRLLFHRLVFGGGWQRLTLRVVARVGRSFWRLVWQQAVRVSSSAATKKQLEDDLFDASLTSAGWEQVAERRAQVSETGLLSNIQLVVVSPMTRTLQTAAGVFGGKDMGTEAETEESPLMISGVGTTPYPRGAISNLGAPPFVAVELCREHINGTCSSNRRRPISTYKQQFPGVDFSRVKHDEDSLWRPGFVETEKEMEARTKAFVEWLMGRREKEIAVVSHCGFLLSLLRQFGDSDDNIAYFANCELRVLTREKQNVNAELGSSISLQNADGT